jgi:hypothetical protein
MRAKNGLTAKERKGCFMKPYKQTAKTTTNETTPKTKTILFSSLVIFGSCYKDRTDLALCQGGFYG